MLVVFPLIFVADTKFYIWLQLRSPFKPLNLKAYSIHVRRVNLFSGV